MKKALLFAVAALCVSAAQAVSINWDGTLEGLTGKGDVSDFNLQQSETATIGMRVTYDSTIGSGALLSVGKDSGNSRIWVDIVDGKYKLVADNMDTAIGNGSYQENSAISATAGGTDIISLHLDRTGNHYTNPTGTGNQGRVLKAYLYVNNQLAAQLTSATYGGNDWGGAYTHEGALKYLQYGEQVGSFGGYTGDKTIDLYYVKGTYSAEDVYATIPEPTALALLALGVAGLALKRKVA